MESAILIPSVFTNRIGESLAGSFNFRGKRKHWLPRRSGGGVTSAAEQPRQGLKLVGRRHSYSISLRRAILLHAGNTNERTKPSSPSCSKPRVERVRERERGRGRKVETSKSKREPSRQREEKALVICVLKRSLGRQITGETYIMQCFSCGRPIDDGLKRKMGQWLAKREKLFSHPISPPSSSLITIH